MAELAADNGSSAGTAKSSRHEIVHEFHAFLPQKLIELWHVVKRVGRHVLVVGQKKNDVWLLLRLHATESDGAKRQEGQQSIHHAASS